MDMSFTRDMFRLVLNDANGAVWFEGHQAGHANAFCQYLNGVRTNDLVSVVADFSPDDRGGIRVDRFELRVPNLPVSLLKLGRLFGVDVNSGAFSGRVNYLEREQATELLVRGSCSELDLAEWTAPLAGHPIAGSCPEIELQELRTAGRAFERLRFRGVLRDVSVGDIATMAGMSGVSGQIELRVDEADLSATGIQRFVASGVCRDLSLAELTEALGWGRMSGTLQIAIHDLRIEDNRLAVLEAVIAIADGDNGPYFVEGALIEKVLSQLLHVPVPSFLPERIEYVHFGVRLDVRDEVLRVFGTHGPNDRTILTVRMLDANIPLVTEPKAPIALEPWLDLLRSRIVRAIAASAGGWLQRPGAASGDRE
jgi:hypothetical protein